MTLAEKLQAKYDELAPMMPGFVQQMMLKADEDLAASGLVEKAKGVGDAAPDFELTDHDGNTVKLSALLAAGPVVVSFNRGGWCPFCGVEVGALQEALEDIRAAGAQLVAISPQQTDKAAIMAMRNELEFPLLSDPGNAVAKTYGLVFAMDPNLRPLFAQVGADVPAYNGDDTWEIPVPATYVIDTGGVIRFAYVNPDYKQRAEPEDILAAVKALTG